MATRRCRAAWLARGGAYATLAFALNSLATGCGAITKPGDYHMCRRVELADNGRGGVTSVLPNGPALLVLAQASGGLGGAEVDVVEMQLLGRESFLAEGDFDLSQGEDVSYASCKRCLLAHEDMSAAGSETQAKRTYYQSTGHLQVRATAAGSVTIVASNVLLSEVTGVGLELTPLDGGGCVEIADFEYTLPSCNTADDCGAQAEAMCDANTLLCTQPQCESAADCPGGYECRLPVSTSEKGICYRTCTPFSAGGGQATGCDQGTQCVPLDESENQGLCRHVGLANDSEVCEPGVGTGCGAGLWCGYSDGLPGAEVYKCGRICNYFSAGASGCPQGQYCDSGSYCRDGALFNSAVIGANCEAADTKGQEPGDSTYCAFADNLQRPLGLCTTDDASGETPSHTCRKICRVPEAGVFSGNDCDPGTTCKTIEGGVQGRCLP
jgi:hypothetical protein